MMSEKSNGEFGAFLAGFVIGGLVGAATALILAPQSGSETRAQISSKGHEYRDVGSQHVQDASARAQEQARIVLDSGKQEAQALRTQVNTRLHNTQEPAASVADEELPVTESSSEDATVEESSPAE